MINDMIEILNNNNEISAWKINEVTTESVELFFIKKSLDMNRAKEVKHITVTVYVDFQEDEKSYRGSSSSEIHPTMTREEIISTISRLTFAASFVKNQSYPLAPATIIEPTYPCSNFNGKTLNESALEIAKTFYEPDKYENGGINSSELFLNKTNVHILNSEGVDVSYNHYAGNIEFITNWKEFGEEIELYRDFSFTDFNPEIIRNEVEKMLRQCKDKSLSRPTTSLKNIPVLFTGSPVKEIFSYYYTHASANAVYNNISTLKIGDNIQGDKISGDKISITLDPSLNNSTLSAPYDIDGFPLSKVELYKDSILQNYWGNLRFSHYLSVPPTGNIENIIIQGGSKSQVELKTPPYLELLAFSDFQMDALTGNFAGEVRFGYYNNGESVVPITGGSVSGNIKKLQSSMLLSKELFQDNNFVGPKTILLNNVSIAGCNE